ncbi:hypothetical protein GIB67_028356 [Kingdonia uniflora]|uniref:Uncharacterized protein n=1 Tax=Kingdonia uniflora TaxID=39325 RepID=A0A7J7MI63_9MAGN|nr:hypothetical protein GIB67_028356 [Kingdonia uniflora]
MATSGSAYADVMEIPACDAGTSSSLVGRHRVKRTVPASEQTTLVQTPQGVDLKAVEQEALDLAKRDPIRLNTQIRSSISQLSVAWKSAAEVLKKEKVLQKEQFEKEEALQKDQFEKEVAAIKKEVEDEAKKAVDIVVASRNKLIQAFYFWSLSKEDINLALAGKYNEIFPGDDAFPVAEQSPAPPVADDTTKEEVVRLRGKMIKLEKALSRARDSINRTQQDVEVENDKVQNMWFAKGNEGGGASTSKPRAEESEEEEVEDLLPHTRHKTHPQEAEDDEQDELVVLSASNKELPAKLQQCLLVVENTTLSNSKLESDMLELQSRLNVVTVELSCKDVEILTANNEAKLWKKSLKKKKLETMAVYQQVLDPLSTIDKQKNNLLYHQSVVTNNIDLLMKQDAEIRYMRERLKRLNWDLREARDSCQRKSDCAKTHEKACPKRDRRLNETINKCNTRIADLDREKQALILKCMQGNKVFKELHVKYKESQRMVDATEDEINYSKEVDKKLQRLKQEMEHCVQITKQYRDSLLYEKKSLADRCKDLEDELNKVKAEFCDATLLIVDNVALRVMAMLHADVEKFRIERESILAASTEYVMKYDLQLARLSYIDNLMSRVMELLNAPSTVVDVAIPFPALLSSEPGESLNVVRPKREK